jgi:formate dehydrogenase major subunit
MANYATYHLQLKPGTNVALLNMMLYYIMQEGIRRSKFIEAELKDMKILNNMY